MASENNTTSNNVVGVDSSAGDSPVSPAAAAIPPPPPPPPAPEATPNNETNDRKRPRFEVGESSGTAAAPPSPPPPPPAVAAAAVPGHPQLDHPCSLCDRRFTSRYALFGHMRTHTGRTWQGAFPPPVFTMEEFADVLPLLNRGGEAEAEAEAAVPPAGPEVVLALPARGADEGEEEANDEELVIDLNEPVYRVPDLNFPPSPPPPPAAN